MNIYVYNVQHTIEVEAENEDEAYNLLMEDDHEACTYIDSDYMLVEVEPIEDKEG